MHQKWFGRLCFAVCAVVVRSQSWGTGGGYNPGFSNTWNSGLFGGGSGNQQNFQNSFGQPSRGFNPIRPVVTSGNDRNPNWNGNSWQSDTFNVKPTQSAPFINSQSSKWKEKESESPIWGSGKPNQNQNSKDWTSNNNNFNNYNENDVFNNVDYEDNSVSSWNSNNKKEFQSSFGGSGKWETTTKSNKWDDSNDSKPSKPSEGNSWGSKPGKAPVSTNQETTVNPSTVDTSILDELDKNDWYFGKESNYPKPPFKSTLNIDVSELWNFDKNRRKTSSSNGNKNTNSNFNNSNNKNNNKNGSNNSNSNSNNNSNNNRNGNSNTNSNNNRNNNSNNKNNNSNNNNRNNSNNNNRNNNSNNNNWNSNSNNYNSNYKYSNSNNRRRNRQIARSGDLEEVIQCECVSVDNCDAEDMIITQEDKGFDSRPLEAFRCSDLTEVCCTNPKVSSRTNINQETEQLGCGQRKIVENLFGKFNVNIAEPGEFPWLLTLENTENCSATLIHHKLALTAAHCTIGALPNELVLKAGVWNSNDEPSQVRKVSRIIPHPEYSSQQPRNDIALLVVEEPFDLTANVNPVCLPVTNDKWDSSRCVVAGWRGEAIGGRVVEAVEKGVVNFLPQVECQNIMLVTDFWRNYILHDSFVCGSEKSGRQSCTGDEGGFVVCPSKKHPDTYLQIGVVSKGMNCDSFGRPGIFTNVLKFLDWINQNYFELGLFDDIDIRSLAKNMDK